MGQAALISLEEEGMVRRIGVLRGKMQWAASEYQTEESPYALMHVWQVAEIILRECGPIMTIDLAVEMRKRNYRKAEAPQSLVHFLRQTLHSHNERFALQEDRRWKLLGEACVPKAAE